MKFDPESVPTPSYVCDLRQIERNLEILSGVQKETGCKILLALKGFAMFSLFPLIRKHLAGAAASSLDEARLAREEMGGEVHIYSPAYRGSEFEEMLSYADRITFNSMAQWDLYNEIVSAAGRDVKCAVRINPEHSEVKTPVYDPCRRYSRLGVTIDHLREKGIDGITGLHFHTLSGLNEEALERTLKAVERRFGSFLEKVQWVNFGGGQHITSPSYGVDKLCRIVKDFMDRYQVDVYLEPGEAVALNAGVLVATVLDVVENEKTIAILDASAAAHMPDVLEMPYRPDVEGASDPGRYPFNYQLAGNTCLAGDIIGDYSFQEPLKVGSRVVFHDMAHYSMVKNNTFNGIRLPTIAIFDSDTGRLRIVREFRYEDYKGRLS